MAKWNLLSFNIKLTPIFRKQYLQLQIGVKVNKALKLGHDGISHAAIDMVCTLMEPMHEDYDLRHSDPKSIIPSEKSELKKNFLHFLQQQKPKLKSCTQCIYEVLII